MLSRHILGLSLHTGDLWMLIMPPTTDAVPLLSKLCRSFPALIVVAIATSLPLTAGAMDLAVEADRTPQPLTSTSANDTILVPSEAATIQDAVDLASPGQTVLVSPGVYQEHVTIDKRISLLSSTGSASTFIVGPETYLDVVTVLGDSVALSGFGLLGGRYGLNVDAGVGLIAVVDCHIEGAASHHAHLPPHLIAEIVPNLSLAPHALGSFDAISVQSGTISETTTWPVLPTDFSYYCDRSELTIAGVSGPVLRLLPGTVVKLRDKARFEVGTGGDPGGLIADGVVFTSFRDDAVGGDSDGSTGTPSPGDWRRVLIAASAMADSCLLTDCEFRYGGHSEINTFNDMVTLIGTDAQIDSCDFADALYSALHVEDATPIVTGCSFAGSAFGITLAAGASAAEIAGNTIGPEDSFPIRAIADCIEDVVSNNTLEIRPDSAFARAGVLTSSLTSSATWPLLPPKFCYYFDQSTLTIADVAEPVLKLLPGTIVKLRNQASIHVGTGGDPGGLIADGVVFTSFRDDAAGGDSDGANGAPVQADWRQILIDAAAMADSCVLTNCEFRYGGNSEINTSNDMVTLIGTDARVESCDFADALYGALRVESATPNVTGCTFTGSRFGITLAAGASAAGVAGNTIGPEDSYPLRAIADCIQDVVSNNTLEIRPDSMFARVGVLTSALTASATWPLLPPSFCYYFDQSTMTIADAAEPVLHLLPGTVLKLRAQASIHIGTGGNPGGLVADGVIFTSFRDDAIGGDSDGPNGSPAPGDWRRILIEADGMADSCAFTASEFRYGADSEILTHYNMVRVNGGPACFSDCRFVDSWNAGLLVSGLGSVVDVEACVFARNKYGVRSTNDGRLDQVFWSCFENNTSYGISADAFSDGGGDLVAVDCWWNDPSGPSGVGPGTGDAVTANVSFTPWATSEQCGEPDWPDPVGATLRLRIEELVPGPSPATINTARIVAGALSHEEPIVGGFVVFEKSDLIVVTSLSSTERIEFFDSADPSQILGHIAFELSAGEVVDNKTVDAFILFHDNRLAMTNGVHPYWSYKNEGWEYFDEDEYPVSMLIPPEGDVGLVDGGGQTPVLFVHGVGDRFSGLWAEPGDGTIPVPPRLLPDVWEDIPDRLTASSFDPWRFYYPYDQAIFDNADLLGDAVGMLLSGNLVGVPSYDGDARVNIVAHSMGGLVARYYIQDANYDLRNDVGKLLMLGTPNHGSNASYRNYYGGDGIPGYMDLFQLSDPAAPAHAFMTPASPFYFFLASNAPKPLATSDTATDYLVVAGRKAWPALSGVHGEIDDQDDGFVAASSASMLNYDVPMLVVDRHHLNIKLDDDLPQTIETFFALQNGQNVAAASWPSWVECVLEPDSLSAIDLSPCSTKDVDLEQGILELKIPDAGPSVTQYRIEVGDGVLNLKENAIVGYDPYLQRIAGNGPEFFSRNRNIFLQELGVEATAGMYNVRVFRLEPYLGIFWKWRHVANSQAKVAFSPMATSLQTLNLTTVGGLAINAPNSWWIPPLVSGASPSSGAVKTYVFDVDDAVTQLVFSLTSPTETDFSNHQMTLIDPLSAVIDSATAASDPSITFEENVQYGPIQFSIDNPTPGQWTIQHNDALVDPELVVYLDGSFTVDVEQVRPNPEPGDTLIFEISVTGSSVCSSLSLSGEVSFTAPDSATVSFGAAVIDSIGPESYEVRWVAMSEGAYSVAIDCQCPRSGQSTLMRTASSTAWVGNQQNTVTGAVPDPRPPRPGGVRDRILSARPNPFNPTVTIDYVTTGHGMVEFKIYDVSGRLVRTLVQEEQGPGQHLVTWHGVGSSGSVVASGVYFGVLKTARGADSRKLLLLK